MFSYFSNLTKFTRILVLSVYFSDTNLHSYFRHKMFMSCPPQLLLNVVLNSRMDMADEKEGAVVKRRGRPRKQRNMEGRRLFDEQSSSEEEDSISTSDHENAQDDDDEEEDAPLIHSIRSSKLRSLKVSREETKSQSKAGESSKAKD